MSELKTCFKRVDYDLSGLLHYLDIGDIGLPDIQRPFFVRINSEGVKLNQADFILTLLSVFWDDGRRALEDFCRSARQPPASGGGASPFNHFIQPDPDQSPPFHPAKVVRH